MKKRLCLFLMPGLLWCCQPKTDAPADLLPEEKMKNVLIDIHLTEAQVNREIHQYDTSHMAFKYVQKGIFKKHGVTDSAFRHSYDFYVQDPEKLDKIYESVIDSLNRLEVKMTEKPKKGVKAKPVPAQ